MMRLLVINGPNLDLLGRREPDVYGRETLAELEDMVVAWGRDIGIDVECDQSNDEPRIIDLVHEFDGDGIVLNPGAFTHTSRAIADAISAVPVPVVEVHISNIRQREDWRAVSVVSEACVRTIYGRGPGGYRAAIRHLANRETMPFDTVAYGPHPDNVGDVRGRGEDLVILAHGGLWRHEFQRDITESLAVDLARRGFTTWNLEYRRLGDGGGWPGSPHDVLTALDFLPQLKQGVGRVIIVSHSAGSQLMMWAASRSSTQVSLHVALAPLLDLEAAVGNDDVGAAECRKLLDAGAPARVTPGGVPTVIGHGDADQIVPVERSIVFSDRHDVEHHHTGCDHFSLLDPSKPEWEWAVESIEATR
jgi:3-dehydroquinate dehydratase-2